MSVITTAAGNSLSCVNISTFDKDIKYIRNLCNIPTFVPKNVFGKETYLVVLEPLQEVNDGSLTVPNVTFKTVNELVEHFYRFVQQFDESTEKVVQIEYLGYRYLWRPKHKTHYGSYAKEYLIQPIIARYFMACNKDAKLNCDMNDALPYKYAGCGTGKGVFYGDMTLDGTPCETERKSSTDTTFSCGGEFITHLYSLNGFSKASTIMKLGKEPVDTILNVVSKLKEEHNITIAFNSLRVLDICRVGSDLQGYCLIKYGSKVEETDELSIITYSEDIPVHILFVETESEDVAKAVFEDALGDIEVV